MFVDTTFCIDLLRETRAGCNGPATRKLDTLGDLPFRVSVFVVCELHAGARLSRHPQRELPSVENMLGAMDVTYPDHSFPVAYGETEAFLRRHGVPVPTMDLLIGVMAKCYGEPLITRDRNHFMAIPELVVETY